MNLAVSRQPAGGNSNKRHSNGLRVRQLCRLGGSKWRFISPLYSATSLCRLWQQLEEGLFDMYMIWQNLGFDKFRPELLKRALRESRADPIWRVFSNSVTYSCCIPLCTHNAKALHLFHTATTSWSGGSLWFMAIGLCYLFLGLLLMTLQCCDCRDWWLVKAHDVSRGGAARLAGPVLAWPLFGRIIFLFMVSAHSLTL